jgi:hypothetical protein
MCMNPFLHGLMTVPIRETTPCFDHEFRRSVTKLQTPSNEFRTRAPTLVWPNCDANREPNWYSPTFPNSTCGSPQFFLHHEATVSYLWLHWPLSSPRHEWKSRMLIANAEIIHKDQCDPYIIIHIYVFVYIYIDLPWFTNPPASQLSRWDKLEESPKVQQSHELGIKLQDYSSKLQVLWRPTSQPQFYVTKTPTYTFTAFTSHQPSHNTLEIIGNTSQRLGRIAAWPIWASET